MQSSVARHYMKHGATPAAPPRQVARAPSRPNLDIDVLVSGFQLKLMVEESPGVKRCELGARSKIKGYWWMAGCGCWVHQAV